MQVIKQVTMDPETVISTAPGIVKLFFSQAVEKDDPNYGLGQKRTRKWVDTKLQGTLQLVQVAKWQGLPVISLRVLGHDSVGNAKEKIFEMELPINFRFVSDLSPLMLAVQFVPVADIKEFVAFVFNKIDAKEQFTALLEVFKFKLSLEKSQVEDFRQVAH